MGVGWSRGVAEADKAQPWPAREPALSFKPRQQNFRLDMRYSE
jgi:hypothetical protein